MDVKTLASSLLLTCLRSDLDLTCLARHELKRIKITITGRRADDLHD